MRFSRDDYFACCGARRSSWTRRARRTLWSYSTNRANRTLVSRGTLRACRTSRTHLARCTVGTSYARKSLRPNRTSRSSRTSRTLFTSRSSSPRRAHRTSRAYNTFHLSDVEPRVIIVHLHIKVIGCCRSNEISNVIIDGRRGRKLVFGRHNTLDNERASWRSIRSLRASGSHRPRRPHRTIHTRSTSCPSGFKYSSYLIVVETSYTGYLVVCNPASSFCTCSVQSQHKLKEGVSYNWGSVEVRCSCSECLSYNWY